MAQDSHPIRVRPALESIATYKPGKGRPGRVRKLSSNENPFPPLPQVVDAIAGMADSVNRYPDMIAAPLIERLAEHHGVDADRITVGNGSCSLIAHLLQAVATEGDEIVMPWRSFEAYPILVGITGARAVEVPLTPAFEHDPHGLAQAVTEHTRAVLLCTPNNPTGTPLSAEAFEAIMASVPSDVLVLLDEAYYDFDDSPGRLDGFALVEKYPNLIAARTFSKAYGLCGLRVGYAVSSPFIAECIRKTTPPFAVNSAAQAAAIEALNHRDVVDQQVATIIAERDALVAAVRQRGFDVPETRANFLWFPGERARDAIVAACERHAISVRAFPDGVRVSVGAPDDNQAFLDAIADIDPAAL
ncbi:histidinol-phosphate transaminase [Nanchangia anserum]|uniref:Histidinol-phosphate aminotransferase n=1 Tax=Nanchangia anserum TaxID=2692125 RepID=A0A8I0GC83_9ACTO|nr:histidinol-phosphate transaminase [Nanchangia anserum]MBD3689611.1 histidinol-phosphate transaminase [Nanchangia anserum]QOX81794.1 histidinol-phosphate transaminase [Nanchangia anserum]